jgi:hypothetical protein
VPHANIKLLSRTEIELSLFESNGKPSSAARMGAVEIDGLIATLAQFRRGIAPEVPRTLPDGRLSAGPVDPLWVIPPFPLPEGKLLIVRNDGLGWLLFQFSPAAAAKLGAGLLEQQKAGSSPPKRDSPPSLIKL